MSYTEFMESPNGLVSWLEMFYKYGISILRGVPVTQVINVPVFLPYSNITRHQFQSNPNIDDHSVAIKKKRKKLRNLIHIELVVDH